MSGNELVAATPSERSNHACMHACMHCANAAAHACMHTPATKQPMQAAPESGVKLHTSIHNCAVCMSGVSEPSDA
eukprot:2278403-Pleurochrysis_carterae.AAC.1